MAIYGFDIFSPPDIAKHIEEVGVFKARQPLLKTALLGILAGAFIGLGALYFVLVISDLTLGFAASRVLGGVVFSLGLLLVVVAGAELFTGNNLLVMAWADGKISTFELLRNWLIVCCSNFAGAVALAVIVWLSEHSTMNNGLVASTVLNVALLKCTAPAATLFWKGVLCNMLVCLAVWMAMAGRSLVDKAVAIVFPISAFVAAGFEHSIANMYLIPLAMLLKPATTEYDAINFSNLFANLSAVIAGNLVGGSLLVALIYYLIYRSKVGSEEQH